MVCQFVSAFDPHPNRPSGSQESGSSRSLQPLVKAPQLGRGAGIQPSASSSTSKSVPARKKGSIRAREGEEPIVADLVSSPRFSADDALIWEPSDSEVELVSVNISSRRKAITSKAGVQDSERGTKRKREIIGKADEADIAESESSQPSSMWADKYAPTTIVRWVCFPPVCFEALMKPAVLGRSGTFQDEDQSGQVMVGRSALWASGRIGRRGEFQQAGSRASEKVPGKASFSPICILHVG